MAGDLSRMASVSYENLILISAPYADKRNKHTWVHDAGANDLNSETAIATPTPVWASVWTGVNPVEWASMAQDKEPRIFCASMDDDGNNRVYEAFTGATRDNGCDFPWGFESRAYTGGTPLVKHLRFVLYSLSEIQGEVNLKISWAGGSRGRWKTIDQPTYYAEEGTIASKTDLTAAGKVYALKKQSRIARTQDVHDMEEDKLTSAGIEGLVETIEANKESVDTAFQIRVEGSGPCAVRSLFLFMDPVGSPDNGQVNEPETRASNFVRFDGAASETEPPLDEDPESFNATAHGSAVWHNFAGNATATVVGYVSQPESDKRAQQIAQARAEEILASIAVPYVGGKLASPS